LAGLFWGSFPESRTGEPPFKESLSAARELKFGKTSKDIRKEGRFFDGRKKVVFPEVSKEAEFGVMARGKKRRGNILRAYGGRSCPWVSGMQAYLSELAREGGDCAAPTPWMRGARLQPFLGGEFRDGPKEP